MLLAMPNVGEDADFERDPKAPDDPHVQSRQGPQVETPQCCMTRSRSARLAR